MPPLSLMHPVASAKAKARRSANRLVFLMSSFWLLFGQKGFLVHGVGNSGGAARNPNPLKEDTSHGVQFRRVNFGRTGLTHEARHDGVLTFGMEENGDAIFRDYCHHVAHEVRVRFRIFKPETCMDEG